MSKHLNINKFINNQYKFFTNIIFVITLILIQYNQDILPLNIIIFIGSIIIYNIYPNLYYIVNKNNKKLTFYLLIYDIIGHWIPLFYVLNTHLNGTTKTNYILCFIIMILYVLIYNKDIYNIYFNPNQYFD
jgi:hypothetical protein